MPAFTATCAAAAVAAFRAPCAPSFVATASRPAPASAPASTEACKLARAPAMPLISITPKATEHRGIAHKAPITATLPRELRQKVEQKIKIEDVISIFCPSKVNIYSGATVNVTVKIGVCWARHHMDQELFISQIGYLRNRWLSWPPPMPGTEPVRAFDRSVRVMQTTDWRLAPRRSEAMPARSSTHCGKAAK